MGRFNGIEINGAPKTYWKSFVVADDNKDGILQEEEINTAVESFSQDHSGRDSQGLLKYLEQSGYALLEVNSNMINEKATFESIAEETGHKEETLAVLAKFKEKGVLAKYGIPAIKDFLLEIAKSSANEIPYIYEILEKMADKGLIDKIGLSNLIDIERASETTVFAGLNTRFSYEHLVELEEKGMIDKIGVSNLVEIAKTGGSDSLRTLIKFEEKGLFKRYGINALVKLLIAVEKAGALFMSSHEIFVVLIDKGLIDKIGVMNLIMIANAAGKNTLSAYEFLLKLKENGAIDKIGLSNLVEMANAAAEWAHQTYESLVELTDKTLIDKIGVSNLVMIAKAVGTNTPCAYGALVKLADMGLIKRYGVKAIMNVLIQIANTKGLGDNAPYAYTTFVKLADSGFIAKYGIRTTRNLAIELAKAEGYSSDLACDSLLELTESGLIDKIGIPNLIEITKSSGHNAFLAYGKLKMLAFYYHIFDIIGISNLVEISIAAGERTPDAYEALGKLSERGLIERIGNPRLVEIARVAKDRTAVEYRLEGNKLSNRRN